MYRNATTSTSRHVLENNNYYPYGLEILDSIKTNNRLKFQGKELQTELHLNTYDFHARMYDPVKVITWQLDPLASEFYSTSPYSFLGGNPLKFIDPTGTSTENWRKKHGIKQKDLNDIYKAPENDYGVDAKGNVSLLRTTNDNFDRLIALNSSGEETSNFIEVEKGILDNKKTNTVKANDGNLYTFDQYSIQGDKKAKSMFEFVANNSKVEWSLTGIGNRTGLKGENILGTTHLKLGGITPDYLFTRGYSMRSVIHSHPNNPHQSPDDNDLGKKWRKKFSNMNLQIYHKSKFEDYDFSIYK